MPAKRSQDKQSTGSPDDLPSAEARRPESEDRPTEGDRETAKGGWRSSPDDGIGLVSSYREESDAGSGATSRASSSPESDTSGVSEPYGLASMEEE